MECHWHPCPLWAILLPAASCNSRAGMNPQCSWLAQGLCGTDVGAAPQNTLLWHQEGPGRICSLPRKSSLLLLQQRQRGWDLLSVISPGGHLTPEPPSWCPLLFHVIAWVFMSPKQFQWEFLALRASHGMWENGISLLQGGRVLPYFRGMSAGGDGEGEWKNLRSTYSPRDQAPGDWVTAVQERMLDPFSMPILSIMQGISCTPMGTSLGCVSNAAECCARLPAAIWRGAIACLFPGCLPALLLHASGFLAVVVLVLLLLN